MKKTFIVLSIFTLGFQFVGIAGWGEFLSKAVSTAASKSSTPLSETKIGQGLKEALRVGAEKAVALTGKQDGYFKNQTIKILMPERLKSADVFLRKVGMGAQMDQLVLSMNRAAEAAAPQAKTIFLDAISKMSIQDVQQIYKGGDTAATQYFQAKTAPELTKLFKPVIEKTMNQNQVSSLYQGIAGKYNALPTAKMFPAPKIEDYVTSQSLNGLFKVLGEQEKAIRQDPAARVTQLLKDVFSQAK
jgi:hypothetical protein